MLSKEDVMGAVARGWCSDENSSKTMDEDLAMAITDEIMKLPGIAAPMPTTKEAVSRVAAIIAAKAFQKHGEEICQFIKTFPSSAESNYETSLRLGLAHFLNDVLYIEGLGEKKELNAES